MAKLASALVGLVLKDEGILSPAGYLERRVKHREELRAHLYAHRYVVAQ
ncbi:MAG: hypothetical protein Q4D79_03725 [Propionibacteriaceae bacterium]|nr:hypothetical protein [Propionibacteriaceae bacterium]